MKNNMRALIDDNDLVLIEAAVVERLRRSGRAALHPELVHAAFIYEDIGREELEKLYSGYVSVALRAGVPILLLAPTWRANHERVEKARVNPAINADAVRFMLELRDRYGSAAPMIKVGGVIGCRNDCYLPEQGLSISESESFHAWQVDSLAGAGADFLIAATLPNVNEAVGIAKAMDKTGLPYVISFVIDKRGLVLDGGSLLDAVNLIDSQTNNQPLCCMVNCSYPSFLHPDEQPEELFTRLLGFQSNASSLSHEELEGSEELQAEDISEWTEEMLTLNQKYGVKILGGCCGTDDRYLRSLVGTTLVE